jgi:succinate dehydrogenase / fumarate reductase cytochrome b subunit
MSHSNYRLNNEPGLLDKVNETLADEGLKYSGDLSIKNFMWVLMEDFGLDKLKAMIKKPLNNLKIAPFYGCYILRPSWELGIDENKERGHYLESLIEVCGASPVDYDGRDKCCGFPIQAMNGKNSKAMAKNHVQEAVEKGADCMVTPCPLCHLQLDANQPDYTNAKLPVLHLPQMIGLAIGLSAKELGLNKNIIKVDKVLA